jgi:hypothetical protein
MLRKLRPSVRNELQFGVAVVVPRGVIQRQSLTRSAAETQRRGSGIFRNQKRHFRLRQNRLRVQLPSCQSMTKHVTVRHYAKSEDTGDVPAAIFRQTSAAALQSVRVPCGLRPSLSFVAEPLRGEPMPPKTPGIRGRSPECVAANCGVERKRL